MHLGEECRKEAKAKAKWCVCVCVCEAEGMSMSESRRGGVAHAHSTRLATSVYGVRGDFNLCFRVVEAVEKGTARCVHALQPVTPPHRGRPQSRFRHRIPGLSV